MNFQDLLAENWSFGAKQWKEQCDVNPNKLAVTFGGFYVSANFGENRSVNATNGP